MVKAIRNIRIKLELYNLKVIGSNAFFQNKYW